MLFLFAGLCGLQIACAEALFPLAYVPVCAGISYCHITRTNEPWSIHVVRFEWKKKGLRLITTLAQNHVVGLSTVAEQAGHLSRSLGRPIAAVNGDFFLIKPGPYQGDPDGLQILDHELVSAPREASMWVEDGRPHIANVRSLLEVQWPGGTRNPVGLNETPRSNSIVLFTPRFGPATRATNLFELRVSPMSWSERMPLHANHEYRLRVESINPHGNTPLRGGQLVLSLGEQARINLPGIHRGTILTLSTGCSEDLRSAQWAIGGRHILVHDGKRLRFQEEAGKAASALRNPRTAAGYNSDYIFLVVVDGRQKDLSVGMSFTELATLMKELGCSDALNLDGGGSSTFWLDGKIVNSPSDKHERAVANALMLIRR